MFQLFDQIIETNIYYFDFSYFRFSKKMDKELNDVITTEYNILDWHGAPVEYRPAPLVALQFHEVRLNLPMPPDPTQEKIKLDKQKKGATKK
jgi:hypothetical protein